MPTTGLPLESVDHARGFRRIVLLLIFLVILPTAALLAVGILMLVYWQARLNLVFGILVVTLVLCLVTGTVLALVLLGREAALSKLQLDFVSKVSHELRTPLTSIRMFAEMLQTGGAENDEVCIEVLRREADRLSERIERLLDWGRMEAGRHVFTLQPEDVGAVVREAVQIFDPTGTARGGRLEVVMPDSLPTVEMDRGAIADALVNLLSNADKYGGAASRITLRAAADPRWVRLVVSDDGPGIPRREHRRIFEKFYRADERLSREVEGSGLGLAIVRHVVRGHGGRIELDSEPGRGSTFTILLPRARRRARGESPR